MDHIVYVDFKARELENLLNGSKTMIIRGAMGRKMPYGRVNEKDLLYFIENKGDGLIKGKAVVKSVYNSEELSKEASVAIVKKYEKELKLNDGLMKRFAGKRYLVLIEVEKTVPVKQFEIDRSEYGNMDDWLPVGDIKRVKI